MRSIFAATTALAALAMAAPASADHHGEMDHSAHDASKHALMMVLEGEHRAEDKARDAFRNPVETLAFFQVKPTQTVVEYGPGGGWYTRLLAPYIAVNGRYMAMESDSADREFRTRAAEGRTKSWPERFPGEVEEWTKVASGKVTAFEVDEVPEGVAGTVDRVLIFRSIHGMLNGNRADEELRAIRDLLVDDGMVGVVQHRAKADHPFAMTMGTRGYLKQADVIKLFEINGFELAGQSEINANPNDPADWEGGVWTLPPVLRYGDKDRAKYEAVGESDRMTLLFKKSD